MRGDAGNPHQDHHRGERPEIGDELESGRLIVVADQGLQHLAEQAALRQQP